MCAITKPPHRGGHHEGEPRRQPLVPACPITTGAKTPRRPVIEFSSQNVAGCSTKQTEHKRNELADIVVRDRIHVYCVQETWGTGNECLDISGCRFFLRAPSKAERTNTRGGVGIILRPAAIGAWERAGSPPPVQPGLIVEAAWIIALELHTFHGP